MLTGDDAGSSMISGGIAGRSLHGHSPNSAIQMRVNTRDRSSPPAPRTKSAAFDMWSASGSWPASRSATYASIVVDRSGGPS